MLPMIGLASKFSVLGDLFQSSKAFHDQSTRENRCCTIRPAQQLAKHLREMLPGTRNLGRPVD